MAEGGENSFVELREEQRGEEEEEEEEELYMQLKELSVNDNVKKGAKCESCIRDESPWRGVPWYEKFERARKLYERVAVFLCFVCKMYVCVKCLSEHRGHEGMKVRREESEKKGFWARIKKRLEREREKKERKKMRREYIAEVMNESERRRKEIFFSRRAIVCDRVEVKHKLDQKDCRITGFCGLENKRWVVCDWRNDCIKIFKVGSHVFQRYIRFLGSDSNPRDATEIHLKQNSTERNLASGSSSDISGTYRADRDKRLIAVTLPRKHQIMFIDLSKKPAKPLKVINTEEQCWDIHFHDDKIFTVCDENRLGSPYYVSILSTDGETLNKFDIDMYDAYDPHFAVVSGRVWLTDRFFNKVHCRNVEGQVVSQITIEGSWLEGICVDPDNDVYVSGSLDNKVYKLDSDLTRYKSVLDQTAGFIERPYALCCYRDKLYIGHFLSTLDNFVTVVRLL